jgi:hypothetical protein
MEKLNTLFESGVYEPFQKDPTSKTERKVKKLLSKHKSGLSAELKCHLAPYHTKLPHLYGLLKIHKKSIPLRPIVSSIGSPCCALAGFLQNIFNPWAGHTESFVRNSKRFIEIPEKFKVQGSNILVSVDVVSLFTAVPIDEALQVIQNKLSLVETLPNRSSLQIEDVIQLLEVCVRATYFQVEDRYYQQKSSMAMGSSLCPVISNMFMEHFEQLALDPVSHKPAMWLRYVDDTFVVWPHGTEKLQEFLSHINSLRSNIQFTMEM